MRMILRERACSAGEDSGAPLVAPTILFMNQQKIIWFAIVFSTVMYFVVAYMLVPVPAQPFEQSVRSVLTLAMYVPAFVVFLAALVVPGMNQALPPRTKMIVAIAMFEACAIMGLMAAILQKDWRLYIPTWIAAVIGFIREFPRDEITSPVL
jgi:hypothetical protein